MSTPPAFLFDLDGTLADTLADIAASTNHVRTLRELPPVDVATVRTWIGDGARMLLRRALAELEERGETVDDALLDAASEQYGEHHDRQCTGETTLFEGAHEHLTMLRERGCRLAVVTNKPERFAVPVVRHLGLDAFTDVVIGGDTLTTKKPDPNMLFHAIERLGCDRADATMVGDGLQDLRAGKAAGVRTIACLFGYGDREALRREGADVFWQRFGTA